MKQIEYVTCKTIGHAWDHNPNPSRRGSSYKHVLAFRCTRCGTERIDGLDWKGDIIFRYYVYPENYRSAQKMARNDLRLALVRFYRRRK